MHYAVLGEKKVWFFNAPNEDEGAMMASEILSAEKTSFGNMIGSFNYKTGYWEAVGKNLEEVIDGLKRQISEGKCRIFGLEFKLEKKKSKKKGDDLK